MILEQESALLKCIEEVEKLKKEVELLKIQNQDLTITNENLAAATWRERAMKEGLQIVLEQLSEKKIIEELNKSLTDSITYARKIQNAIIPKHNEIKNKFRDIFICYKPKNIVSGDLPWIFEINDYIYVAAIDCTGHGVPGAMMSLIAYLLLNDLAKRNNDSDPATLLSLLHWEVVKTLRQEEEANQAADGMDMALCRINLLNNEILFAGAHRPLYHLSKGDITIYNGDKFPIGGNQYKGKNSFTNHFIKTENGDSIYLFSDGLPDQFGGEDERKFGGKRMRELLLQISHLTMQEQHVAIQNTFDQWRGKHKQLDDLLMIGITV